MIELRHVSKTFETAGGAVDALKDVSLTIEDGDIYGIIGMSGAGKSTLVRCMNLLERPTEGEVVVNGQRLDTMTPSQLRQARREITMIFQHFDLLMQRSCLQNVCFPMELAGVSKKEAVKRAHELLELVGLPDKAKAYPAQLSGGQQQRVALARALVLEPGVLLFDEPLSNLDAKLRVTMRTEIRRIQQEAGITAIYVTHDQSEAMALSDQIIIMEKGVVAQIGTPQEIYYHPASEFVADFIGEANFLKGKLSDKDGDGGIVTVEGHAVPVVGVGQLTDGKDCTLVLRPESAVLADSGILPCKVIVSCFMGSYQNYHVMVGDTLVKITDYNPRNKKVYEVGDTAWVSFEKENIHVL